MLLRTLTIVGVFIFIINNNRKFYRKWYNK